MKRDDTSILQQVHLVLAEDLGAGIEIERGRGTETETEIQTENATAKGRELMIIGRGDNLTGSEGEAGAEVKVEIEPNPTIIATGHEKTSAGTGDVRTQRVDTIGVRVLLGGIVALRIAEAANGVDEKTVLSEGMLINTGRISYNQSERVRRP